MCCLARIFYRINCSCLPFFECSMFRVYKHWFSGPKAADLGKSFYMVRGAIGFQAHKHDTAKSSVGH